MKAILVGLLVLALGASGVFAAGPLGDDASTERTLPLITSTDSSSTTTTTETGEDVPGPCDEPEHANDPRCAGGTTTRDTTTTRGTTTNGTTTTETRGRDAREPGEDVRGPCDEAEHANDPRCAPGGEDADGGRGGNSGPGGGDDSGSGSSGRGGSEDDDDRSGSNSGSG